jgi:hypothetical protein
MGRHPEAEEYSEFRHMVEYLGKSRYRFKREFLPPMAAWILMLGRRQQKAAEGLRSKYVMKAVPGMLGCADWLEKSQDVLSMLMRLLTENFDFYDWEAACKEVKELMGIKHKSPAVRYVEDDLLPTLLPPVTDARDASGSGADVHPGGRPDPLQPDAVGTVGKRRTRSRRGSTVAEVPRDGTDNAE